MKSHIPIVPLIAILCTPNGIVLSLLLGIYNKLFQCKSLKIIAGEIAVVTGGGGGLGRAISVELAKHGCHVAVVDINCEEAEKTVQLINENYKVNTKAYKVDITSYDAVVEVNKNITNDLGKSTILVNNAGILTFQDFFNPTPKEVQNMINVNLTSHVWTNKVFLENMKEVGRGHIVAICSAGSFRPVIFNSVYTATKYAIRGFMRALRIELKIYEKCRNIKTTTVYPTYLDTNKTVLDFMTKHNVKNIFPVKSGALVANRIVEAMLRDEVDIGIPDMEILFSRCTDFWPAKIYDWMSARITLRQVRNSLKI